MNTTPLLIVGAGHQGLAMAAHLGYNGIACNIWNRSASHIECIARERSIMTSGVIEAEIPVMGDISTDISEVLSSLILITTPSSAHRDVARMLAPFVNSETTIVLNPGRTLGAVEFKCALFEYGCTELPLIAEAQTIVYTCRRDSSNGVHIFALKDNVPLGSFSHDETKDAIENMPDCLSKYYTAANSWIDTSFGNVGMILHCAPVLMNIGWIESREHGFEYYYDGISPTIARFLECLDGERMQVASALGATVESLENWLKRTYGTTGSNLYEHLQSNAYYRGIEAPMTIEHRYIEEDIPNGLVALESAAVAFDVPTPNVSALISFANAALGRDFRAEGRNYQELMGKMDLIHENANL